MMVTRTLKPLSVVHSDWLALGRSGWHVWNGRRCMAWMYCPMLERDIAKLRSEVAKRKEDYAANRRRFKRGGNFTGELQRFVGRRFGEERDAMRVEEKKLRQLEDRLDMMVQKHRRHCLK
eukprot:TRINITY_DN16026_c0_g1_i2.p1 TRINITY_DN16026_c0_g1~~TRINITY_DN16026_c0_g1_i2.p1  ORF type:complete len:120 (+),score=36.85 TRINITY_DN16026_c0_g1_i2:41-400(+)